MEFSFGLRMPLVYFSAYLALISFNYPGYFLMVYLLARDRDYNDLQCSCWTDRAGKFGPNQHFPSVGRSFSNDTKCKLGQQAGVEAPWTTCDHHPYCFPNWWDQLPNPYESLDPELHHADCVYQPSLMVCPYWAPLSS